MAGVEAPPVQYSTTRDGRKIAYTLCGEGEPFVFLPALFSHVQLGWRRFGDWYQALKENFTFVNYDARGQGMSTRGLPDNHSMEDWQLDLEAVLEAGGFQHAVLM